MSDTPKKNTHPNHKIRFEKAILSHKDLIFEWLDKPHVKEFWDNSPEHRDDILNFVNDHRETSRYNGIFTYWIGSIENEPYCLLMTSEITPAPDLPKEWGPYLSKTGKTFSIDFMIGNEDYLGKGLASPTLEAFTQFIKEKVDPSVDRFIIDPAENNPRAKHVYEKAGFETVAEFVRDSGFFKGLKHFLMVKRLPLRPQLVEATLADCPIIQQMGKLYENEMLSYCSYVPGWVKNYFKGADHHVFLIKVGEKKAGFALINKVGSTLDVDWNMGEFFILPKFQNQAIGQQAAMQILNQFNGVWEAVVIPENTRALYFWRKVIARYTHGNFAEDLKTVDYDPDNPKRIIFRFNSPQEA